MMNFSHHTQCLAKLDVWGSKNLYAIYNRNWDIETAFGSINDIRGGGHVENFLGCVILVAIGLGPEVHWTWSWGSKLYTKDRNGHLTQDMLDTIKDSIFYYYSATKEVDYFVWYGL